MKSEDTKYNDLINNKNKSGEEENDIRRRLRKNPNKTKLLYTDDFNAPKSKKKNDNSSLNEKEICRTILEIIKKDEKSALFRQPAVRSFIDPEDKEIYRRQIKEPRDLGLIAKRLKMNDYSPKNFYDDLELCWSNALLFNDSNTEAYQYAIYLKGMAHKLYKEKGLIDILNKGKESKKEKEKDKEKDINTNNTSILNNNTNDSSHSPIKNNSKVYKKVKNNTKTKKENDKSDKNESICGNTFSNYTKINRKAINSNNILQNNNEIKNSKMIGKKRKRSKIKDNKILEKKEEKREEKKEEKEEKNETKSEENIGEKREEKSEKSEKRREKRNNSEEKVKKSKKRGRKKKSKTIINNKSIQESKESSPEKLMSMDDVKYRDQLPHKFNTKEKDLDKILQNKNHKTTCIKINNPQTQLYSKTIIHHHRSKSKHKNQNNNNNNSMIKINSNNINNNINRNINNNINNNSNINNNRNINNNNNINNNINNNNYNNINFEVARNIFDQLMIEFFNNKNGFVPNMLFHEFASKINSIGQNNYGNNFNPYPPIKNLSENREMVIYDNNSNKENVYNIASNSKRKDISAKEVVNYENSCYPDKIHNISSNSKRKKISGKETINKKNIIHNSQKVNNIDSVNSINSVNSVNDGKNSCNESTVSTLVKVNDKKEDKYLQLRLELAKYFNIIPDNDMVSVLVYIENIRPQSLKILANNTIYIDMEAFNDETFDNVFNFVKNYIN